MKVSVITPFYKGEKYLERLFGIYVANQQSLEKAGHSLEVLLVNDSPWLDIEIPDAAKSFARVIKNPQNKGIHYSRVSGFSEATGEYIMFLDQDDLLADDALIKLLESAVTSNADAEVANANLEQADGSTLLWYRTDYHKSLIGDLKTYLRVGIQIISPGQVLLKKEAVPEFWLTHIILKNGADDYFLWLLMLAKKCSFHYYDEALYIHKYTAANLSADTNVTDASVFDFMDYLYDCDYFSEKDIFTLHEMITYKNQFRAGGAFGKVATSIANIDLFMDNVKFKKKTGTGYGFNR